MPDNPFKSQPTDPSPYTAPASTTASLPPAAPGALTAILVICLILGIFGLIGSCMGGVSLGMMGMIETMLEQAQLPEDQKVFNQINMDAQKSVMLPAIILMGVNVIVAIMLIIGSIGCMRKKETSRQFMGTALLAAIIYSVLKIAITIYNYFAANAALNTAIEKLNGDPIYDSVKTLSTTNQLVTMISVVVGIVLAVVLLGFYLWARSYINKPAVEKYFAAVQNAK